MSFDERPKAVVHSDIVPAFWTPLRAGGFGGRWGVIVAP